MKKQHLLIFLLAIWIFGNVMFFGKPMQMVGNPILFDPCDNLIYNNAVWRLTKEAEWNVSLTVDTTNMIEGSGCISVNVESTPYVYLYRYDDLGADLTATPIMRMRIKISSTATPLNISVQTAEGKYYYPSPTLEAGSWTTVEYDLRSPLQGSPNLTEVLIIRFNWEPPSGTQYLKIDLMEVGAAEGTVQPLTVSISPKEYSISQGSSATFTATADGGIPPYTYSWELNGQPQSETSNSLTVNQLPEGTYTIKVTVTDQQGTTAEDMATLTVTEPQPGTQQYTLTVNAAGDGTTSPSPGTYVYDEGAEVTLVATPNEGAGFDYWLIDNQRFNESTVTIQMNANHEVTAYFTSLIAGENQTETLPPLPPPPTQETGGFQWELPLSIYQLVFNGLMLAAVIVVWRKKEK